MKDDSQRTAELPSQSRLKESIRTDVCIIGAGIAGLTTAYLLASEGRSVVVLDDGLGGGEKLDGEDGARLTAESHTAAVEKIRQIIATEQIDCGFEWLASSARQAQFHPLKYRNGLVSAIRRFEGHVFGQTHVTKVEGGSQARIETSHGPVVTSEVVAVATNDGPFIGRHSLDHDNIYLATSDSSQGMTYGTIAGMLLSDLIQGRTQRHKNALKDAKES